MLNLTDIIIPVKPIETWHHLNNHLLRIVTTQASNFIFIILIPGFRF